MLGPAPTRVNERRRSELWPSLARLARFSVRGGGTLQLTRFQEGGMS